MHHGMNGILYRTCEYILLVNGSDDEDGEVVVCATCFFSVPVGDLLMTFVKEELYSPPDGDPVHTYTGNPVVVPTSQM